ncbi:MAG: autotransporter-associated beta strand repeat-containing protein, partial [Chthoniobacterales bacterium]
MKIRPTLALFACVTFLSAASAARAGSATWNLNPTNSDWNTATNWTPNTVPDGPADTATFDLSNTAAVAFSATTEVNGIVFDSGASSYTITTPAPLVLTVSGAGVMNNSGATENFTVDVDESGQFAGVSFTNSATVGTRAQFTLSGGNASTIGSQVAFLDSSGGGNGTFIANGATVSNSDGARILFENSSTAANATIVNNASTTTGSFLSPGGITEFSSTATAANATITCMGGASAVQGGGMLLLENSATAGNATIIGQGGTNGGQGGQICFDLPASGGTARIEVFGNAEMGIFLHMGTGVTVGSIEGSGVIYLTSKKLTVGNNDLSTTFSGTIIDLSGGQLAKVGTGSLTLSGGNNTYSGATTVSAGTLVISNTSGSATGTGMVQVSGGTLGGSGIVSGAVTVNSGAFLAPAHGTKTQTTLTIQSQLTFNAGSTYTYTFKAKKKQAKTDKVIANG